MLKSTHAYEPFSLPWKNVNVLNAEECRTPSIARRNLVICSVLYGLNYVPNVVLQRHISPITANFLRFGIAALYFLPGMLGADSSLQLIKTGIELGIWCAIGFIAQSYALRNYAASKVTFFAALSVLVTPLLDSSPTRSLDPVIATVIDDQAAPPYRKGKQGRATLAERQNHRMAAILARLHSLAAPFLAFVGVIILEWGGIDRAQYRDILLLITPFAFAQCFARSEQLAHVRRVSFAQMSSSARSAAVRRCIAPVYAAANSAACITGCNTENSAEIPVIQRAKPRSESQVVVGAMMATTALLSLACTLAVHVYRYYVSDTGSLSGLCVHNNAGSAAAPRRVGGAAAWTYRCLHAFTQWTQRCAGLIPGVDGCSLQSKDTLLIIAMLLFSGIFATAWTAVEEQEAVLVLPASEITLIYMLEPVLAAVLAVTVLGEPMTPNILVGGCFICIACILGSGVNSRSNDTADEISSDPMI
jgi:drug/metabolite transporter (DMT)-like permease